MKGPPGVSRTFSDVHRENCCMVDVAAVAGFVGFTLAMLGLIWALDRV